MREIFTSGTVGGALGNQCFYPEMQTLAVIEVSLDYTAVFTPTPSVSRFRVLGVFCIDRIAS
jgi:hypothetical protein